MDVAKIIQVSIAPMMLLLLALAIFMVVRTMARCYIKVPPDKALVVYGRRYKGPENTTIGYKIVTGGAWLVLPFLEHFAMLGLDAFQVKFAVKDVPSKEGARVTVNAVATLRIGSEIEMITRAARRFLGKESGDIRGFAQEILEGGLRGVVATLTIEQLVQDRHGFSSMVTSQVADDLSKLGLELDNFLIQDIGDPHGYIDALGRSRTAEVKRDAAIGEADAKRDEEIRVAEATRTAAEQASAARMAGEIAKAEAEQAISDAARERDTKIAQNRAAVEAEQARIVVASQIAAAQEQKKLNVAAVEAKQAEVEAQTKLQQLEKERHNQELLATTVIKAEREREAAVIGADGVKQATIIKAEGEKQATITRSEGERAAREQQAEADLKIAERQADGRKAQASAQQTEMEATATGQKAKLLAEAEGTKAQQLANAAGKQAELLAEAEGSRAKLLAEAEGVFKKAEAYQKLDQTGRLLELLQAAPRVISAFGEAVKEGGEGTVTPMAEAIGKGLANVKEIRLVDFGGNGAIEGQDVVSRFTHLTPTAVLRILQEFRALGLFGPLQQVLAKAGIDLSNIFEDGKVATIGDPK